jgi:HD-like signal output (HDOD) protein
MPTPDPSGIIKTFLASGSLPLSRSVSQVQNMLRSADYNAADLAEHLRMDPTLAARVMSVANSAFFARSPCDAIDDAVNRLGTVQLTRIFAQVLASAALMTPLQAYALPADAIWRRSVFAAVGAELAAGRQGSDRSASYMVGLLHQVGMLVINNLWTKQGGTQKLAFADFEREYSVGEKTLCGFDQAELGAELLKQLAFPESVHRIIGRQYRNPVEPVACALYMGRLARAFACDAMNPNPNQEVLLGFRLSSTSQLDVFLSDVRQEAQNRMQGG